MGIVDIAIIYVLASLIITFCLGLGDEGSRQPSEPTEENLITLLRWLSSPIMLVYATVYSLGWAAMRPWRAYQRRRYERRFNQRVRQGKDGTTGRSFGG